MKIFPVSLLSEGRECLLVGAGTVALKKARKLLAAGARLRVAAPKVAPEFRALAAEGKIELREREFLPEDAEGAFLVVAATNDAATNSAVLRAARERGAALVCASDFSWREGDFILPALVESADGGLNFAVSSGGENHRRTRAAADALRAGAADALASRADAILADEEERAAAGTPPPVVIAGAGVGRGNVTLNVVEALRACDVCLHDALIPHDVLGFVRAGAEKIDVGKRRSRHAFSQAEISAMCVAFARSGRRVVRLKGGDPTIFARLREELDALRAAGIAWKILPGVSAFQAAAAGESLPLTERGNARSVRIVTGALAAGGSEIGGAADAPSENPARQIIYMGVEAFPRIAARLLAEGVPAETPVLAVFGCGGAREFSVSGTLDSLKLPKTDLPGILFVNYGEAVNGAPNGKGER
ncbi:MAG: siroheme synthase [Candidatus Spyradosoma sp.]